MLVGCGASLRGFDFNRLCGLGTIIAVKEAVWDLPFADHCFGLDVPWMHRQREALSRLAIPLHLAVPKELGRPDIPNAIFYERIRSRIVRLSIDPNKIECGRNSGFGALNLAFLMGAKRIVLFGYDYQPDSYYCPQRYTHKKPESVNHWPAWAAIYEQIKEQLQQAGVEVINASPSSTITAFPKIGIEETLHLDWLRPPRGAGL